MEISSGGGVGVLLVRSDVPIETWLMSAQYLEALRKFDLQDIGVCISDMSNEVDQYWDLSDHGWLAVYAV